jgi:hypothetical protein
MIFVALSSILTSSSLLPPYTSFPFLITCLDHISCPSESQWIPHGFQEPDATTSLLPSPGPPSEYRIVSKNPTPLSAYCQALALTVNTTWCPRTQPHYQLTAKPWPSQWIPHGAHEPNPTTSLLPSPGPHSEYRMVPMNPTPLPAYCQALGLPVNTAWCPRTQPHYQLTAKPWPSQWIPHGVHKPNPTISLLPSPGHPSGYHMVSMNPTPLAAYCQAPALFRALTIHNHLLPRLVTGQYPALSLHICLWPTIKLCPHLPELLCQSFYGWSSPTGLTDVHISACLPHLTFCLDPSTLEDESQNY